MARRPMLATKPLAADKKARRRAVDAASEFLAGFSPAYEVLTSVRAVRTVFPQFDWATRVGGLPIERITTLHGPSNQGKTLLSIGFIASFLRLGHFAMLVDAERTTPIDWVTSLLGDDARSPRFTALRPTSYEQTVDVVRRFLRHVSVLRDAKKITEETAAIVVVDSIRKLVPEDIMARIAKEGASGAKGSVDGMGGRAAQIRAAMNAQWLDELVPLLEETRGAMVLIARESEDPNADVNDRKFGNDYRIGGGKSVIFDASLVARIQRAAWLYDGDKRVVGERLRVSIHKTKVGGKEGRTTDAYFHVSNGALSPEGFDFARDYLELATKLGVIDVAGGWYTWGQHKWHGEPKALAALTDDEVRAQLDVEVRARFASVKPEEYDEDGCVA